MKKLLRNKKIIIILDILLIVLSIKYGKDIYDFETHKARFTKQLEQFSEENKNPVFKIGKIILYSSANAVDNSEGKLEDISISQFTDIAIYLDNKNKTEEITAENTIKELYIDNIKLKMNSNDKQYIFNYKNPKEFGKYSSIENYNEDKIVMNVISTNGDIENANFNNNIFYTDCSNPISLGFVNKDFITNGRVLDTNGQISFDGSILKSANVDLKSMSGVIEFFIHIKNNLGENFICNSKVDIDLTKNDNEIFNGYNMVIDEFENNEFNFLKISTD